MVVRNGEYFDNCFEAQTWFTDLEYNDAEWVAPKFKIGDFVRPRIDLPIYNQMGGSVKRVAPAYKIIGEITGINSKGNWLYVKDFDNKPAFVPFNKNVGIIIKILPSEVKARLLKEAEKTYGDILLDYTPQPLIEAYKAGERFVDSLPDFRTIVKVIIFVLILILLIIIFR